MTSVPLKPRSDSDSPVAVRRGRKKLTLDRVSFFLVFLGLPLAIYLFFVVSPFVQAIYYSLTNWSGFTTTFNFIGLDNFVKVFQDDVFVKSMMNNLLLAIVVPLITIVIALIFSTMVTIGGPSRGQIRGLKGSSFYRVVSFFPYVIPAIAIGIIWAQAYTPNGGLINSLFGLGEKNWLGDSSTAMGASIFVIVWGLVGFYMVLFIAAIKGVPAEIYEAARVDGAGRFRIAVSITIPLIRDNVQTGFIYMGILALDAFVYMAALNPDGGPENSTWVMAQHLLRTAFTKGNFGLACAMAVVAAILTLCFAGLVFLVNRLTGGNKDTSY
ncbi:carbohydrate ABC transporter permease [Psychromicrobium lacuslunae]|uniref:Sugar ABC transporter permease n=1 Tax=Psychromicrobium lacuslunae TaxID=1618207 RepID=A0A0D4C133_9MICC|nr:sugar ABC transporter permease [Psychromicrobium lacuslunae]AJT42303.1 sugar ABC transporter permease [Psychromicrobium lacuslunae]